MLRDDEEVTGPQVLLLDDDGLVALAHARWLRSAGLRVDICGSPSCALERIAAGERFEVVLCDVQMPPDIDGVAFYVSATAWWPELRQRIIFLSGGLSDEARRFIDRQRLPFFAKPLAGRGTRDELVALIQLLAERGRQGTAERPR